MSLKRALLCAGAYLAALAIMCLPFAMLDEGAATAQADPVEVSADR